jgi:hypothetical protein
MASPPVRSLSPAAVLLVTAVSLGAIACVDPAKRFQEFNERIIDAGARIDAAPIDVIPDITGEFYLAVAPDPFPGATFHFVSTGTLTRTGDGLATVIFSHHPLDARTRVRVGDPMVTDEATVDRNGQFSASFGGMVDGRANEVTGSELTVAITFHSTILTEDVWCGVVAGGILSPLSLPLDGSPFGAVRIAPGTIGDDLPDPVTDCPEIDPDLDPDAGVPDAGVPDAMAPDAMAPDAMALDAMPPGNGDT